MNFKAFYGLSYNPFDKQMLHIWRSSQYLPEIGVFEDETKNASSKRIIKLSKTAVKERPT